MKSKWPAADESHDGTVQGEIITNINPSKAITWPMIFLLLEIE